MKKQHLRFGFLTIFLCLFPTLLFASVIKGKGGIMIMQGFTDYALLRGQVPGLPAAGANPTGQPGFLESQGLYLSYFGIRGFSEALGAFRPGLELAWGVNVLSSNGFMDVEGFLTAFFLQFMPLPFIGIEANIGYNWLGFFKQDVPLGHFYGFPRVIVEIPFSKFVALTLFAGFYLPMQATLWKAYVQNSQKNSLGLTGILGTLHTGISFVVSEDLF